MSGSTEETYSAMFSSLRHPARRKILKMLSEKDMTFSQMLEELGIPGSHLTYHLENLSEFLVKMPDGKYKLSSVGEASVSIMKGAEEVPNMQTKKFSLLPFRWKTIFVGFAIGIILLASISCIQLYSFNQLSSDYATVKADLEKARLQNQQIISWSSAERAMTIIRDVVQIDTTKYQTTLLRDSVENRSDLGNTVEELLQYSLTTTESKIDLKIQKQPLLTLPTIPDRRHTALCSNLRPTSIIKHSGSRQKRHRKIQSHFRRPLPRRNEHPTKHSQQHQHRTNPR